MDIVVLGAGALGTILAAHLVEGGHAVSLVARGRRAEQIAKSGLIVSGLADVRTRCGLVSEAQNATADLLIVTVKTYDTEAAINPFGRDHFKSVFSVANGVAKNSQLVDQFGAEKVLGCMADTSGELLDSGEVAFTRNICLHLGELTNELSSRASDVVQTINTSGVNALARDNIESVEWSKFVGWTALLVLATSSRASTGNFLAEPNCAALASSIIHEMAAIASAKNIAIIDQSPLPVASIAGASLEDGQRQLMELGNKWIVNAPGHRLSALQDLERGKHLEVHETLGFAVEEADRLRIPAPTLRACYPLIAGINGLLVRQ
jgi:2-dehydropantoate 2-reductase